MFDNLSMNISASGLAANQLWLNVIANNIANVNLTTQMVDLIQATRAYQANATAFDAAKQMAVTALSIGK
ncbi:flagellar basal body rod protein FlgC [Alicyclobacillus acidocaldarius]|uniref:Flagellar basal-body/hook protein C-terminal domain-containing protein n=1 Tax=Alicyclobacillus acidocaldarius subsp. acidocaldarius (strain ATCC 27009 / DSM 446 / BCRC 14685 / JCM 5260 / KCTC 1825 / NBRC 15652 / NCIMB 11725 / NRRL B-14509 / 104-IA) TaxID=521098 RepID=C8WVN0_ALIAD|nr:flagellar basal body rod C-terminal domain-containing protein [Alicyclobacillus acidocaldarius]ACV58152.1 protein of unknown function DUF1078 domain protein [Alicyclobacillus acidocaldarius subsp. acidocaldarius DSM 446]